MLGPRPPTYCTLDEFQEEDRGARARAKCMLNNLIQHPSLLSVSPTGDLWDCQPSTDTGPTSLGITHFSQSILATDPDYQPVFQPLLDPDHNIHHIEFTIGTRITDREEGRCHEILLVARPCDSDNQLVISALGLPIIEVGIFLDAGGWAPASAVILPIIRDIFGDWRCVIEYLKYQMSVALGEHGRIPHPLIHMDVLGDGPTFRKAELRFATSGVIVFGPDGVTDRRRWQELRDGRWVTLDQGVGFSSSSSELSG